MTDETELLQACVRGDTEAFGAIVEQYKSLICAITFSATRDVYKSEELAQEAFIMAWKNLAQLKDLGKFRAWLYKITRSITLNYIRNAKTDVINGAASIDDVEGVAIGSAEPVERIIEKEQQAMISRALEQIPENYRMPLVLYFREQKSLKRVAEELGLSEEAARQRVSRGVKMLKKQVASMVETAISRTRPGKAFTTAVVASVAGMVVKGSVAAAGASAAAAATSAGTGTGAAAILSGAAAKIVTAAAVVAIGIGAVVTYRQVTKGDLGPDLSKGPVVVREEAKERDEIAEGVVDEAEEVPVMAEEEAVRPGHKETVVASVADDIKTNSKVHEPVVNSAEPEPMRTEDAEFEFKAKGVLSGLITDAVTGEPVTDAQDSFLDSEGSQCHDGRQRFLQLRQCRSIRRLRNNGVFQTIYGDHRL